MASSETPVRPRKLNGSLLRRLALTNESYPEHFFPVVLFSKVVQGGSNF